ncbi:hypothetical protein JOC27_000764 [Sporolactobacillus spathodeae]|uniref:Uncharacterized protein n=1 Tax=Sporolactobacillus spathodeae TaxID=1465502 RepID=A0ABS2Q6A5_9BACL|nr:hypothetical protein [Sporolactobacillus spathodeae]
MASMPVLIMFHSDADEPFGKAGMKKSIILYQ